MREFIFLALVALIRGVQGFKFGSKHQASVLASSVSRSRSNLMMTKESFEKEELISVDKQALHNMREKLTRGDYGKAFTVLKRNPMMNIEMEDAKMFLNHINELVDWDKENGQENGGMITMEFAEYEKKMTDCSTFIYNRLKRQELTRGFGCLQDEWPVSSSTDVKPATIAEMTGLEMTALTPKARTLVWQLVGMLVFFAEYQLGERLGVDPIYTIIPATFIVFLADQVLYKGAGFESIYQFFAPQYKEKVVRHEAGHFLLAYLAGIPVRACVTSATEAQTYPEINGAAGTVFYDTTLQNEIANQKVTRTSINRMSVVLMAGIAAEAIKYEQAEGGTVDERSLIQFLTTIQPPWNILRVQGQARWAALQAILVLREHEKSYEALVQALKAGKPIGDCVEAIERNLPTELPSTARLRDRAQKATKADMNALFAYIRKKTFKVGGIQKSVAGKDETRLSLEKAVHAALPSPAAEALNSSLREDGIDDDTIVRATGKDGTSADELIAEFTKKISELEQTAGADFEDAPGAESGAKSWGKKPAGGGVWLNGLQSLDDAVQPSANATATDGDSPAPATSREPSPLLPGLDIPEPLPGYEERLAELQEQEKEKAEAMKEEMISMGWTVEEAPPSAVLEMAQTKEMDELLPTLQDLSPAGSDELATMYKATLSLLETHRGFQMKEEENTMNMQSARRAEIEVRLEEIAVSAKVKSKSSA